MLTTTEATSTNIHTEHTLYLQTETSAEVVPKSTLFLIEGIIRNLTSTASLSFLHQFDDLKQKLTLLGQCVAVKLLTLVIASCLLNKVLSHSEVVSLCLSKSSGAMTVTSCHIHHHLVEPSWFAAAVQNR